MSDTGTAMPLAGRVALVTGATSGIGQAIATGLLAHGARVVAIGRRKDRLAALARVGGDVLGLAIDLSAPDAASRIGAALAGPFADVDILINNAGHDSGGNVPFHDSDTAKWEAVVQVNFLAMMRLTRALLPGMVRRGRGDIVNISSITTRRATAGLAAYGATKHAVHGFSEALRAECGPLGIRVVEIVPGVVRTEFAATRWDGDDARAEAFYQSFPSHLAAEDVARAVIFALQQPAGVTVAELTLVPTKGA
ncbi:MAG TPA: SDR family oxidoreductase [Vineibacter sp.]|nr:SDR family oxidoreductase [Vineibacter sp.]